MVGKIAETRHPDKKVQCEILKAAKRRLRATDTTGIRGAIERRTIPSRDFAMFLHSPFLRSTCRDGLSAICFLF